MAVTDIDTDSKTFIRKYDFSALETGVLPMIIFWRKLRPDNEMGWWQVLFIFDTHKERDDVWDRLVSNTYTGPLMLYSEEYATKDYTRKDWHRSLSLSLHYLTPPIQFIDVQISSELGHCYI